MPTRLWLGVCARIATPVTFAVTVYTRGCRYRILIVTLPHLPTDYLAPVATATHAHALRCRSPHCAVVPRLVARLRHYHICRWFDTHLRLTTRFTPGCLPPLRPLCIHALRLPLPVYVTRCTVTPFVRSPTPAHVPHRAGYLPFPPVGPTLTAHLPGCYIYLPAILTVRLVVDGLTARTLPSRFNVPLPTLPDIVMQRLPCCVLLFTGWTTRLPPVTGCALVYVQPDVVFGHSPRDYITRCVTV